MIFLLKLKTMFTALVVQHVPENLVRLILSVQNRMFTTFLQLNAISKCLFQLLLLILIRWKKTSLPECTLRQKTGVVMMIMIIVAAIAKVKTATFITADAMSVMTDVDTVRKAMATKNLMMARKVIIRRAEKDVMTNISVSHISTLQNSLVFLTKSA